MRTYPHPDGGFNTSNLLPAPGAYSKNPDLKRMILNEAGSPTSLDRWTRRHEGPLRSRRVQSQHTSPLFVAGGMTLCLIHISFRQLDVGSDVKFIYPFCISDYNRGSWNVPSNTNNELCQRFIFD